jgi:hypothetical protein
LLVGDLHETLVGVPQLRVACGVIPEDRGFQNRGLGLELLCIDGSVGAVDREPVPFFDLDALHGELLGFAVYADRFRAAYSRDPLAPCDHRRV